MTTAEVTLTDYPDLGDEPATQAAGLGTTTITPKVVEKIARRAAADLDGVVAPPSKARLRIFVGQDSPSVSAHIDGATTWVELRAGIRYPLPLVSTGRTVQQVVRERITALTGLQVAAVDVELACVFDPSSSRRSAE